MATRRLTRHEKREQTRNAILRSASTLFARRGVEGTSMEEIARHAGLTQGAIYSNFKSKDDLWRAIAEQRTQTLDFEDFLTGDRPLRDELRDMGAAGARLLHRSSRTDLLLDQEFHLFLMRHAKARADAVRVARDADREAGVMFEDLARKNGTTLPLDGEQFGLLMSVIARGLLHQYMLDPDRIDEEFCADAFELLAGCADHEPASQRRSRTAAGSSHQSAPVPGRRSSRAPSARS